MRFGMGLDMDEEKEDRRKRAGDEMVVGSRCFFVAKNGKIRLPLSAIHGTLFSNLTDQSQSQCQQLA
jgi:hypothetical protein